MQFRLTRAFPMSRAQCLSLQLWLSMVYSRTIIMAESMWQSSAAVQSECSLCSGQKSSDQRKLLYLISAMSVLILQNALVQMKSSIQKKKITWKKQWRSPAAKDTDLYSKQQDRFQPCIWPSNLLQTKLMYALSVLHMRI